MQGLRIMIVAGEASGDLHGANLASQIREIDPEARLFGMGGSLMKEAGVRLLFDPTSVSTIGFLEALKNVSILRRVLLRLGEVMDRQNPDVVVLIDFPGFNMRLADIAHRKNIPVVYYFSPTAWAWGKGRAEKLAKTVTKIASVFPFEAEVYEEAGADVTFVGHPLLDIVKPTMDKDEAYSEFGLDSDRPVVALLPGSREGEIKQMLPVMLKSARMLLEKVPQCQFISPRAHTVSERLVKGMTEKYLADTKADIKFIEGKTYDVLQVADAAVITCGTATLEAAIMGTPHVAVYKTSASTYMIGKLLLKIPFIALPNIVAERQVVPELLQNDANPERIMAELAVLLTEEERVAKMKEDFAGVVSRLGKPGAVSRTAELVVDVAKRHRSGELTIRM